MSKTLPQYLLILMLVCVPAFAARADDESPAPDAPKADEDPSPLEELKEEHLEAEAEPTDPIEFLRSFHTWLAKHEASPPRSRLDSALYDVWNAALRPRAGRMSQRVEKLMKRKYWLPEEGTPMHVKPDEWSRFVREIAGLMTELHGAWKQYDSARVLVRRGIPVTRLRPTGTYYGYAHPVRLWRRALNRRIAVGARHVPRATTLGRHAPGANPGTGTRVPSGTAGTPGGGGGVRIGGSARVGGARVGLGLHLGRGELYSYWNLLHRYRRGWGWRIDHCYGCEQRRLEAQQQKIDFIAERQRIFDTTRDTLQQQMLSLQVLAAAMQAQAEHNLNAQFSAAPVDASPESIELQSQTASALFQLREARLTAERYSGDSSARYGHLLRGWVRAYKGAAALLAKTTEAAKDTDPDD